MTSTLLSLTSPDNAWMVGGATLALVATAAAYLGGGGQSEEEKDVVAERTGNAATLLQSANLKPDEIEGAIAQYEKRFEGARTGKTSTKESIEKRKADYQDLVNQYYDLATDFYEYGWGQSFHFAPRNVGEGFMESIARAEYFIASRLGLKEGHRCLDIGCGVGGPMRNIQRFSNCAQVVGINNSAYQIKVGRRHTGALALTGKCVHVKADFMNLPTGKKEAHGSGSVVDMSEGSFDAAYELEATCHAPDRTACFKQIFNKLRPGGRFAGLEWVMTKHYDENNPEHVAIKEGIEEGNGILTLTTEADVIEGLRGAGFEVIETFDLNEVCVDAVKEALEKGEKTQWEACDECKQLPWYLPLQGSLTSFSGFRMSSLGRACTHAMVSCLEAVGVAPKGSIRVSKVLNNTADDLVAGGEKGIFTPSLYFLAVKPE